MLNALYKPATRILAWMLMVTPGLAAEIFVSPTGSDAHPGTLQQPLRTLAQAQRALRESGKLGSEPATVHLLEGTYYLEDTLVLTPEDSGSAEAPVTYAAHEGQDVVISGGFELDLDWKPYRDGILQAKVAGEYKIDQLFVNDVRRPMARYPNYDPEAKAEAYNGHSADAFSPERAARWADPAGGYIHAMHSARWGGYHYRITGKDADHNVTYEGGWQNNRQMGMHKSQRMVENIFEELDAPGEWFFNARTKVLYFYPPADVDVETATFETARLSELIEFRGSQEAPVKHIALEGLTFRHAARTFMETKEPLLRSDWTIYRGGAVLLTGAEDCRIEDCSFDQVGGNAVFVNKYNRRVTIRGVHIQGAGASAVAFVGSPDAVRNPLFEYHQRQRYEEVDLAPGPKTDEYPADCVVENSLIHSVGVVEKQGAGVQISMSKGITVRHCSVYDTSRAGINISEGTFGGHLIEYCDVFDTVLETHDHGSFNSWGRDRFWHLVGAPKDKLAELSLLDTEKTIIRNSRWRCDHGWDIDLDDGSSHYEIYNNLMLRRGLKLREGFHRTVYNNVAVNNAISAHVWYEDSRAKITGNIWMTAHKPAGMKKKTQFKSEVNRNLFMNETDRAAYELFGWDQDSLAGDPLFVDPARGDYRVKEGSPAFDIGFKNFPMDRFGVQKPELKAMARTPELPEPRIILHKARRKPGDPIQMWQGAKVKALTGEEFSAFGVSAEDGGVHLVNVPKGTVPGQIGLRRDDVIQKINGVSVSTPAELEEQTRAAKGRDMTITYVRGQMEKVVELGE